MVVIVVVCVCVCLFLPPQTTCRIVMLVKGCLRLFRAVLRVVYVVSVVVIVVVSSKCVCVTVYITFNHL